MRGKVGSGWSDEQRLRITPAYAGKSLRDCPVKTRYRDHPRVCGEKQVPHAEIRRARGSPPRMRGKVLCHISCNISIGDHSRVCGEKSSHPGAVFGPKGSPPRMRGKVYFFRKIRYTIGITPAYAGKRKREYTLKTKYGEHPRVCGEKYTCAAVRACRLGSPPRMRGKASAEVSATASAGITPAYAGKSYSDASSDLI